MELMIKTIDEAFELFARIISDKEHCEKCNKIASNLAYQIDVYALATILNFFNKNLDMTRSLEQSNLLVIRMYSLVTCELIKYLTNLGVFDIKDYSEPNSFEDIIALRNKIHQFRYRDYERNIQNIDERMGRSRDIFAPHIDICLKYSVKNSQPILMGTNVYQYHFVEAKEQLTVNFMQNIIRTIENLQYYPPVDFEIRKNDNNIKYRWESYCYTDIIKNSKIRSQRVIDRVLLAFDDLCSIYEFFYVTICVDEYIKEAPYLLYYLCKIVAIFLDETFDNFKMYIEHNSDEKDSCILKELLDEVDCEFREYCRTMRNNLHYGKQEYVYLGNVDDMYDKLKKELDITNSFIDKLREVLNINPSNLKLMTYRLLRWVQTTNFI